MTPPPPDTGPTPAELPIHAGGEVAPGASAQEVTFADLELEMEPLQESRAQGWRRVARGLLKTPTSALGALLLALFAFIGLAAPIIAPCPAQGQRAYCGGDNPDPYQVPKFGFGTEPQPPMTEATGRYAPYTHYFGTTPQQYDIYYGVVWGTRTAFEVGILVTLCTLVIGLSIGALAGFYGGWIDEGLMRIVEVVMAFPFLLAAITLATILRASPKLGQGTLPALIALIVFGWTGYSRLIRADILSVKQREYVWASKSLGASDLRLIVRHILPNAIFPVLVVASLNIGTYVLSFAALSFLGVGVPEGYADWGQMIAGARDRIPSLDTDWYIVFFPGIAITLFVLAWNLIGDAFRDLLDPRLQGGGGG